LGVDGNSGSTPSSSNGWIQFYAEVLPVNTADNIILSVNLDGDGTYDYVFTSTDNESGSFSGLRIKFWKNTNNGYVLQFKDLKVTNVNDNI